MQVRKVQTPHISNTEKNLLLKLTKYAIKKDAATTIENIAKYNAVCLGLLDIKNVDNDNIGKLANIEAIKLWLLLDTK